MGRNLEKEILALRESGLGYRKIAKQLGCSRSLVCYHCAPGQKQKARARSQRRRKENPLLAKVETFIYAKLKDDRLHEYNSVITDKKVRHKLNVKVTSYSKGGTRMFTVDQLLEKIGDNPVCALTGESIDLNHSRSYHLDHIIPRCKGGDNSLENCQILSREANLAKGDLSVDEFVELCRKVVNNADKIS